MSCRLAKKKRNRDPHLTFVAFLGITLLENFLGDHPLLFAVYWFFCVGLVLFMLMLALYDFAAVKGEFNVRSDKELADVLKQIEEQARANEQREEDDS